LKKYRLDVRFLARTVAIVLVLWLCTHFVHGWQMSRHARALVVRAEAAELEGDSIEAGASLGRALAFDPADSGVRLRYGLYLAERAATPQARWHALQVLRGSMAAEKDRPEVFLKIAETALELGETSEALKYLTPALSRFPDRADLFELDGRVRVETGEFQVATRSLRRALEIEPGRVNSARLLAELLRGPIGNTKLADEVMDRLVKDNPNSAEALLARSRHRIVTARLEPARTDLALARQLAPQNPGVWSSSAELEALRGDFATASTYWHEVLSLKPQQVEAYLGLARAERECDTPQKAIEPLRNGLKHLPDQPDLLFTLADLLIERGQTSEADHLRSRLPKSGATGRSYYLSGRFEQHDKNWLKASTLFVRAAQSRNLSGPTRARLFQALALCHANLDARDQQAAALRQAYQLDPVPSVCLEWARLLLDRRVADPKAGESALMLLRSLSQMPVPPRPVWLLLARALIEQELFRPAWQRNWTNAERAIEQASKIPADAVAVVVLRLHLHLLREGPAEARKFLIQAQEQRPDEPLLWKLRAELALYDMDPGAVQAVLEEADRQLANRIQWLLLRTSMLSLLPSSSSLRDLQKLESTAIRLSAEDRDRLERHLAEAANREGNHSAVERLCKCLLGRHPGDLRPRVLLVHVKLAAGDLGAANALVAELRRIEGEEGTAWRGAMAACLIDQAARGDRSGLAQARKLVGEVAKRRPGWAHSAFLEGRLADLDRKPAEALESYRRVLQQGEYPHMAVRRVVQLLADQGRFADANGVLEVVQWHGELERDFLRPAAEIALRAGNPDRACALAQTVVSSESKSAADLTWLGQIFQSARRHTEAQNAFTQAVRLDPVTPDWYLPLLSHLVGQGQAEQAEVVLAQMQRNVPAKLLSHAVAKAREAMDQAALAKRAYRNILKTSPHDFEALMGLVRLYVRENRTDQAEHVLQLLFDPDVLVPEEAYPQLRRTMALVLTAPDRKEPQLERALELLELNSNRHPEEPADVRVTALVRGVVAADRSDALRSLEALPEGALSATEKLRLAQLYDAAGQWVAARKHLLAVLEGDSRNTGCMAVLIDGLLRHGKKAEATGWLERLTKIEPDAERTRELRERFTRDEAKAKADG
jgi:tetratricopeptide (TPR) repeat protein